MKHITPLTLSICLLSAWLLFFTVYAARTRLDERAACAQGQVGASKTLRGLAAKAHGKLTFVEFYSPG